MAIDVWLGNHHAIEVHRDEDGAEHRNPLPGKRCTHVVIPDGTPLMAAAGDITAGAGVWAYHSNAAAPAWIASTDPMLAAVLASHYGCEVRDPDPDATNPDNAVEG